MKYADINKRYTEYVAEYMSKGYTINTQTMRGSQGEVTKIDFTDGKEIIRVMLNSFYDWRDGSGFEIIVGKVDGSVKPHQNDNWHTVWNDKLEIISSERFYKIDWHNTDYYVTKEEAYRAEAIRRERYKNKPNDHGEERTRKTSPEAIAIAKRIIRNKLGFKRISDADVELFKTGNKYKVTYHGKSYTLR